MLPRERLVLEFWDRSRELSANNEGYRNFALKFFNMLLESDIKNGDLTTSSLIGKNKTISAHIIAKERGIIAGLEELNFLNKGFKLKFLKKDGDKVKNNEVIAEINGSARKILSEERANLNLLQRMSGIATIVASLNKKFNSSIKLAATRKTLWGLLDKKAVSIGHGLTHRLNLNDGIIIKDNHLAMANHDFKKAIDSVKNKSKYVEIEVENKKQALKAAAAIKNAIKTSEKNIFALMLDKINPAGIKSIIKELKRNDLYSCILIEASGDISSGNLISYSGCGVDILSMGSITNSAKVLNMSLEVR